MILNKLVNDRVETEYLLDMISSVSRKKNRQSNDLRVEVMLKNAYHWADQELKRKQQRRKRKWEQKKNWVCKRPRHSSEMNFLMYTTSKDFGDPLNLDCFFEELNSDKMP